MKDALNGVQITPARLSSVTIGGVLACIADVEQGARGERCRTACSQPSPRGWRQSPRGSVQPRPGALARSCLLDWPPTRSSRPPARAANAAPSCRTVTAHRPPLHTPTMHLPLPCSVFGQH